MKKGDIVRVKAELVTAYGDPKWMSRGREDKINLVHCPIPLDSHVIGFDRVKTLYTEAVKETFLGILIGKTYIATGHLIGGHEYDDPYALREDKRHPCWKVEPVLKNDRYLQPVLCLEEDLEMVAELNISHLLLMSGLLK